MNQCNPRTWKCIDSNIFETNHDYMEKMLEIIGVISLSLEISRFSYFKFRCGFGLSAKLTVILITVLNNRASPSNTVSLKDAKPIR